MRILVISNLYPPHYIGGYELGCRDIVEALRARGHDVRILTSTYGVSGPQDDGHVYRWLQATFGYKEPDSAWPFVREMAARERTNNMALKRLCRRFKPDVIYAWNMREVSVSMLLGAQKRGLPVCYFVSDQWLAGYERDPWYQFWRQPAQRAGSRLLKRALRPLLRLPMFPLTAGKLDLSHVQFCSQYLKRNALECLKPVSEAQVIHWGVHPDVFHPGDSAPVPKRLLYVGQLLATKGPHTVIKALKAVVETLGPDAVRLTVAGGSTDLDYERSLRDLVRTLCLEDCVEFTGLLPREALPDLYRRHDLLVFATIGHEPFSISLLEALASGLAVVSTCTGGTGEILQDGENALLYPADDDRACAAQILRLCRDPTLFDRVRRSGRESVESGFTFDQMVVKIESALAGVVK